MFSARPLTLDEISEVVATDVRDRPHFDPEGRLPELGGTLTKLFEPDYGGDSAGWRTLSYCQIRTFSLKEYLVSNRILPGNAQRYRIQEIDANAVIAEDCLAYLLRLDNTDFFEPAPLYPPFSLFLK